MTPAHKTCAAPPLPSPPPGFEDEEPALAPVGLSAEDLQGLRQAVIKDVEAKVKERSAELLHKGKQLIDDMQQKHTASINSLQQEVQQCNARQLELERENDRLKQAIRSLSMQVTQVSMQHTMLTGCVGRDTPSAATISGPSGLLSPSPPGAKSTLGRVQTASSLEESPFLSPNQQPGEFSTGASALGSPLLGMPAEGSGFADLSKLPEVPAFPFATPKGPPPQSPLAQLSLAEALPPPQTPPQRTPLSLANSLSPPSQNGDMSRLQITLRKADGAELGLYLLCSDTEQGLRVEGVRPEGAVQAWNRQCQDKSKEIVNGDRIVSVNGITQDPDRMLEECKEKQLLRLVIERANPLASTMATNTTLRADANVFVPQGASSQDGSPDPGKETDTLIED
mmetsp:Transcript_21749/g.49498  ORF Transcript_21749/g.49498 Transcript_21749/m.49498 type:complete len:396 (+) Transcript_21749:108-1295(+)